MTEFNIRSEIRGFARWKSQLIIAGFCILAPVGIFFCVDSGSVAGSVKASPSIVHQIAQINKNLAENPGWKKIMNAWNEAQKIAAGGTGDYPFDSRGKSRILTSLSEAGREVNNLCKEGLLTKNEAGLLGMELSYLSGEVESRRTTEQKSITCYMPLPMEDKMKPRIERITDSLPLLEKILQERTIKKDVISKVLDTMEGDIDTLAYEKGLVSKASPVVNEADKLIKDARARIKKIRALMKSGM